ncbi:MAG: TerB family tellurite resistance protein [Methanomicrobiales archaeon]|jgi:uncharacterized tellurite resistance protein B-like protein
MGLFDRLSSTKFELNPKSAMFLAAITMIGVDGVVEDSELSDLHKIVRGDDANLEVAFKMYKAKEIRECIPLIATSLSEKQKIATICILLDLAMSDGILVGNEEKLMNEYINTFGIKEDIINDIVDVIALKNDPTIFK